MAESVHETETAEVILHSEVPLAAERRRSEGDDLSESAPGPAGPAEDPIQEATPADPGAEDVPAEEVPEEAPEELGDGPFNVTLEMSPGERLGALLDVLDMKTLRVVKVREEGRLKRHNQRVPDHLKVQPGYYIIGVNGKSGRVEEMVEELRRSRTWRLRVARKWEFSVTLQKSGPLCLDLQFEPESDCIVIRKIGEGIVKAYNQSALAEDQKIKVGDRILGVNSTHAPARTLLETIRGNDQLTMKIGRPKVA